MIDLFLKDLLLSGLHIGYTIPNILARENFIDECLIFLDSKSTGETATMLSGGN